MAAKHDTHENHSHQHAAGCGHTSVKHDGHLDYVHDGHLHRAHDSHVDECRIEAGGPNPDACTPNHACGKHDAAHRHGAGCGHEAIPHAGHMDYLIAGHLHHAHGSHCDDHGPLL